jgi:hypothetical protein
MKRATLFLLVVLTTTVGYTQEEQNPENLGDNFSLEGALALFKQANTLADFEKAINQEGNNVNNLDLNNDGDIDYITVTDLYENNAHSIVLATDLNETDKQDIASINIEKTNTDTANLQIEGDPDLFAANTIVEPFDNVDKPENTKGGGPSANEIKTTNIVVNVWFWPCVQYLYAPTYVVYASPHRWGYYPVWFKPWRPYRYPTFYANCAPHRLFFRYTNHRRMNIARNIYIPRRRTATIIIQNNNRFRANRNGRIYNNSGFPNRRNNFRLRSHQGGRRR